MTTPIQAQIEAVQVARQIATIKRCNMTHNEIIVLEFLADNFNSDGSFWGFDGISKHTKLDRRAIRRACRSLRRKGYTEFLSGLWNDEGPAGSGYGCTKIGVAAIRALKDKP